MVTDLFLREDDSFNDLVTGCCLNDLNNGAGMSLPWVRTLVPPPSVSGAKVGHLSLVWEIIQEKKLDTPN